MTPSRRILSAAALAVVTGALSACGGGDGPATGTAPRGEDGGPALTVYSGRNEELVGPLLARFERESGIRVRARYGDSGELASTLLEEKANSPADVFFSQDAGALGAVSKGGLLARLPEGATSSVDQRFRADDGTWVGTSGRARIVAYSTKRVTKAQLPATLRDLTEPRWRGKVGWAPTNASFQASVTAMRKLEGDAATLRWLRTMVANRTRTYENNIAIRDAVAAGELDAGLINHYYVAQARAQQGPSYPVAIHHTRGDAGALINVAGVGILKTSGNSDAARRLVAFLLSRPAQQHFAGQTKEYPLAAGVRPDPALKPLDSLAQPEVDLADLDDLQATVRLIEQSGAL